MPEPITHVRNARAEALALRCEAHDADPGQPCFGTASSGLCMDRYHRGVEAARLANVPARSAEAADADLRARARAARNAALHERQREHQERAQKRYSERNQR